MTKTTTEFDQKAHDRAQSVWECPECGHQVVMRFMDLATVGVPLCSCGIDDDMELVNVIIADD